MDKSTVAPETSEEVKISRRRLLQIIAATGGAVTASALLPNKWVKPLTEVGVLPVHAQISAPPEIDELRWAIDVGGYSDGAAQFHYRDPACQVDDSATLRVTIEPCGEIVFDGKPLSETSPFHGIMNGTSCEGYIGFYFNSSTGLCNVIDPEFCVQLTVDGRVSNELCSPTMMNRTVVGLDLTW